jgi:hypothetical protein
MEKRAPGITPIQGEQPEFINVLIATRRRSYRIFPGEAWEPSLSAIW